MRGILISALLLVAASARAQSPTLSSNTAARDHFAAGLAHARDGDFRSALREFESAYAIQPHFSVLYNIAQARSTLGKPVEAVAAFESYLAEAGNQIPTARRQEVQGLLASNWRRIGFLRITAASDARVWLNGEEVSPSDLKAALPLATGRHTILYSTSGSPPTSQVIEVSSEHETTVILSTRSKVTDRVASIGVECNVPDVEVSVDDVLVGRTPLKGPLLVPAGRAKVRFWRIGYEPVLRAIRVTPGAHLQLACDQRVSRPLAPALTGSLRVRTLPLSAEIIIDGEPLLAPNLPIGRHRLRVQRDGYLPLERDVQIAPNKTLSLQEQLAPNAATRKMRAAERSRKRTTSLALGGAALGCIALGGSLYLWNDERFDAWAASRPQRSQDDNLGRVTSIQRIDDVALFSVLVGSALAFGAGWLFMAD